MSTAPAGDTFIDLSAATMAKHEAEPNPLAAAGEPTGINAFKPDREEACSVEQIVPLIQLQVLSPDPSAVPGVSQVRDDEYTAFHQRHRLEVTDWQVLRGDLCCGRETNAIIKITDEITQCAWWIGPIKGADIRRLKKDLYKIDGVRELMKQKSVKIGADTRVDSPLIGWLSQRSGCVCTRTSGTRT